MRVLLCALPLLIASPAFADEASGKIVAFDRVANVIVLDDKTIWPLGEATETSADLVAGDEVTIVYTGSEDAGVDKITSVMRTDG